MKKILNKDIWFIIMLIFVGIITGLIKRSIYRKFHIKRRYTLREQMYDAPYLSQGASSVDSENQFALTGNQWKGQPNKCYSCERDMQMRCGDQCAYQATKSKCFDC